MPLAEPHPRKVWTRADMELLDPALAETLELVGGEVIDRMGKKPPHTFWKNEIRDWLQVQFGNVFVRSVFFRHRNQSGPLCARRYRRILGCRY